MPISLPAIFDSNPDLKSRVLNYLSTLSPQEQTENVEKLKKFIDGEMTWAEIQKYPKKLLKELASIAYLFYQKGNYQRAEILFKGLSIIDHNNWYYRQALGVIYQKQKLLEQAIEEYTVALKLNDKELSNFVHRGECYLQLDNDDLALEDFNQVLKMDPKVISVWAKRANAYRGMLASRKERKN